MTANLFPRFSGTHEANGQGGYLLKYYFERNPDLLFPNELRIDILMKESGATQLTTDLTFTAAVDEKIISVSSWTEAFTVESAADLCQLALIAVAGQVMVGKK